MCESSNGRAMESWTLIILGATGDLAKRRLIPTLYQLLKHKPDISFAFVAAAKEEISIDQLIKENLPHGDKDIIERLIERSYYCAIDADKPDTIKNLALITSEAEKDHALSGNRLLYFAVPSELYCVLTTNAVEQGLVKNQTRLTDVHHRAVYEKPFGWNAQSANDINQCILSLLTENQIYRIDHYLTKSLVTALILIRFSNAIFESLWTCTYIEQIQIILSETETIEGRGSFYDHYGALKDVVQNHIFELLALLAMEKPSIVEPSVVSQLKNEVLKNLVVTDGVLGQYEGYKKVTGVKPDSTTETYALLRCQVNTSRWEGIPFFIKTGKCLDYKSTEIHIVFKALSKGMFKREGFFNHNRLVIKVSPEPGFILTMNTQTGPEHLIRPLSMEFCYRCTFGEQLPHSYEMLFDEVMRGDKSITVSPQEIESAWNVIMAVEKLHLPLSTYQCGTMGPDAEKAFTEKYGILWRKEK